LEENNRRFGVDPANQRNAFPNTVGELLKGFSESLVESGIAELAADKFTIDLVLVRDAVV
jgi:hypothetical protein